MKVESRPPYEGCRVYGPYRRKDGRQHVCLITPGGVRKTVSYPKYLVEIRNEKPLEKGETVDHIDTDFNNNNPGNLRIIKRSAHSKDDVKRNLPVTFVCPACNAPFKLQSRRLSDAKQNSKQGKAGPFCTRSCAGSYSKGVQLGDPRLPAKQVTTEVSTNKRERFRKS